MKLTFRSWRFAESPAPGSGAFTSWIVSLQYVNVSADIGARSDRLVGELKLDK